MVLTSPLTVDGLKITGSMIQLAIEMAKLSQEVDALEVLPVFPRIKWKKSPYTYGDSPLTGSLCE